MAEHDLKSRASEILARLGVDRAHLAGGEISCRSPLTGEEIARVAKSDADAVEFRITRAQSAFEVWREMPAPRRGELVRLFGEALRAAKDDLAQLNTIEVGKIPSESAGEVQEMIDICDFAVGLSRQLYGKTIATERPGHRMMETWHPLGVVGVISAFNFPVAVWAWNAAIALMCGNALVWKPSEKASLSALACDALFNKAARQFGDAPVGLLETVTGAHEAGEAIVDHKFVRLVSATGSTRMGRVLAPRLARRFARSILELGGNNAAIVSDKADLDMALRACAFSAMGTAGQRCTSLRRLFAHEAIYDDFITLLKSAYASVSVGDPLESGRLVGPLIDKNAYQAMQDALGEARSAGGVVTGGERIDVGKPNAYYVRPALVEMTQQASIVHNETFAPILYAMRYRDFNEAIRLNNEVAAGLSSSIFTKDMREAELFMSAIGSDCGIVNVNIGTSGAEIGGAFGGEKETGGGREAGSDAWKAYMRRATNTINYSSNLALAQGVSFDL